MHTFGSPAAKASATSADGTAEGLARLRAALEENERSARDAMIVHFVQDELTAAPGGPYPHISPIGAYDAARRRVLVLDVDREWYEPYWVSDEALFKAMSRRTSAFGAGGWVLARFGESAPRRSPFFESPYVERATVRLGQVAVG
ncbi:MAG: phytochelatin synthase family protein [Myxococcales bacterium]